MLSKQLLRIVGLSDIAAVVMSELLITSDIANSRALFAQPMHFFAWPTGNNNAAPSRIPPKPKPPPQSVFRNCGFNL